MELHIGMGGPVKYVERCCQVGSVILSRVFNRQPSYPSIIQAVFFPDK